MASCNLCAARFARQMRRKDFNRIESLRHNSCLKINEVSQRDFIPARAGNRHIIRGLSENSGLPCPKKSISTPISAKVLAPGAWATMRIFCASCNRPVSPAAFTPAIRSPCGATVARGARRGRQHRRPSVLSRSARLRAPLDALFGGRGRGSGSVPDRRARRFRQGRGRARPPCQAAWRAEQRFLPRRRARPGCIARAIKAYDENLILLAPAHSRLAEAGAAAGLRVALEIFADRTYEDDGALTPRSQAGRGAA